MHILESQNISDFLVAQRGFIFLKLPRVLRSWAMLVQELLGSSLHRDGVVGCIEHLESQSALLDSQIANLTKVSGVDVAPGVALPRLGEVDVGREVTLILVRLNHVADAEGVDVVLETTGKRTSGLLAADFGQGVAIRG